jgi:hypothetical protein
MDISITHTGVSVTSLSSGITQSGSPAAFSGQDLTGSKTYRVTAADGTYQDYTVTVNVARIASVTAVTGNLTSPNGFAKTGGDISAAIQGAITLVAGTDSLGTVITLAAADYSVDALTPSTAGGNVTATLRVPAAKTSGGADITTSFNVYIKSDASEITDFYFTIGTERYGVGSGVETGSGSISGTAITVTVPYGTDLSSLAPAVAVSGGASTDPVAGTFWGSPGSKTYRVTAEDGINQTGYTVTVNLRQGITISGITVEGLGVFTFTQSHTTVSPNAEITITALDHTNTDVTVTATKWYVVISGPANTSATAANFNMPSKKGFYNINVFATIDGIPYSGSFGLIVE